MHSFLLPYYQHAHRVMVPLLWFLFLCSLGLSPLHDTYTWALVVGLPAAALPTLVIWRAPQAFAARALVGASFMVFAALMIHQSAAMTEMHFGIFVLLAFLLCYRDWKVVLVGAATIAVHHLSFSYLQEWGYGVLCFTEPGLGEVVLHALFVVVEAGVLSFLAVRLHQDAIQAGELQARVAAMTGHTDGSIDLSLPELDAISPAGRSLDTMTVALRQAICNVREGTHTIATAADNIATSNQALAERSEEQSNSLTETASAMAQITAAVQNSTRYTEEADALARSAAQVAERGSAEVARVVSTMGSISASSKKIADIVSVIDGIAFQTNILALNAAVEAARAGEQGRGFAVVAGEVRTLAQRAATASKEIHQLINISVQEVSSGGDLVTQAGQTMTQVMDSIRRVTVTMAEIRESAREQQSAIEHINEAVLEMDSVTQQNVAMVDDAASTSATLSEQVQRLVEVVQVFHLQDQKKAPAFERRLIQ